MAVLSSQQVQCAQPLDADHSQADADIGGFTSRNPTMAHVNVGQRAGEKCMPTVYDAGD